MKKTNTTKKSNSLAENKINRDKKQIEESKKDVKESKLVEKPVYDLRPQYDSRNSFYGKARVNTGNEDNQNQLYSYGTLVAEIVDGVPRVYGTYSQTTLRHIKEWLKQLGFRAETSKQIIQDYGYNKYRGGRMRSEGLKESTYKDFDDFKNSVKNAYEGGDMFEVFDCFEDYDEGTTKKVVMKTIKNSKLAQDLGIKSMRALWNAFDLDANEDVDELFLEVIQALNDAFGTDIYSDEDYEESCNESKEKVTPEEIEKDINDLPNYKELAKKIADYVNSHDFYNLAQISQIIDNFYGKSVGNGVAEDITCLFESCKESKKSNKKSIKESLGKKKALKEDGYLHSYSDAYEIITRTGATAIGIPEVTDFGGANVKTIPMNLGGTVKLPFGFVRMVPALHSAGVGGGGLRAGLPLPWRPGQSAVRRD